MGSQSKKIKRKLSKQELATRIMKAHHMPEVEAVLIDAEGERYVRRTVICVEGVDPRTMPKDKLRRMLHNMRLQSQKSMNKENGGEEKLTDKLLTEMLSVLSGWGVDSESVVRCAEEMTHDPERLVGMAAPGQRPSDGSMRYAIIWMGAAHAATLSGRVPHCYNQQEFHVHPQADGSVLVWHRIKFIMDDDMTTNSQDRWHAMVLRAADLTEAMAFVFTTYRAAVWVGVGAGEAPRQVGTLELDVSKPLDEQDEQYKAFLRSLGYAAVVKDEAMN